MAYLSRVPLAKALSNCCAITINSNVHTSTQFYAQDVAKKQSLPAGYRAPRVFSLLVKETYKPGMSVAEVGKLAKEKYASLSDQEKTAYKAQVDKIAEERRQEFDRLSEIEKQKLLDETKDKLKKRRLTTHRHLIREFHKSTNRPKIPPNQYILFVQKEREKANPSPQELKEFTAKAAEKWRAMSEAQKKPYKTEFEKLRADYVNAVAQWKQSQPKDALQQFKLQQKQK